jgi:hypothetical protein
MLMLDSIDRVACKREKVRVKHGPFWCVSLPFLDIPSVSLARSTSMAYYMIVVPAVGGVTTPITRALATNDVSLTSSCEAVVASNTPSRPDGWDGVRLARTLIPAHCRLFVYDKGPAYTPSRQAPTKRCAGFPVAMENAECSGLPNSGREFGTLLSTWCGASTPCLSGCCWCPLPRLTQCLHSSLTHVHYVAHAPHCIPFVRSCSTFLTDTVTCCTVCCAGARQPRQAQPHAPPAHHARGDLVAAPARVVVRHPPQLGRWRPSRPRRPRP